MDLTELPTTDSGAVRKADAMDWLESLGEPSEEEMVGSVIPKPYKFTGSTFPTPISNVRITGTPEFITAIAKLLKPLLAYESSATRLSINLQQIEDRDTGELTGNYALYLSAAQRGREGAIREALLGNRKENDAKLMEALAEG